jgi:superfamily II DNA or RNA helicase
VPTIYDNIDQNLLPALRACMSEATSGDFCVGYFNLRGWGQLADLADSLDGGDANCINVLVGMQRPPEEEMREAYRAMPQDTDALDAATRKLLQRKATENFLEQLRFGVPTSAAEEALQQLAQHLRAHKVRVKLYLRHPLHAKLYLLHREDLMTPLIGFVGSSNLTLAGLTQNGELNVDVVEQDAANKLHAWFLTHWEDTYSVDVSDELATLIETSWARDLLTDPYLVYLKMVYHLSEEARQGEREFKLPTDLRDLLLDFQESAVSLAVKHLHVRGGVLLADVVGLGKTFMAIAIARIVQDDQGARTLIICPPNLRSMWQQFVLDHGLNAHIVPSSMVSRKLPELPKFQLLIIDESHNLRNREGQRYQAIRAYIELNEPRCLLLTATPYNKEYLDLSNQLRLFVEEKRDTGVRPERYFAEASEADFVAKYQASPRSLVAFEQSQYPDDWRDLMRLYMVRRTRKFIIENYAEYDRERRRHFVRFPNGVPMYFPIREPRNLSFALSDDDPEDQYARLYSQDVVDTINHLHLPRYGLANYINDNQRQQADEEHEKIMQDLARAGRRLMGFCRTNLFKRLESTGHSFLLSVQRHVLRNMITLHAIAEGLPLPIGTQDAAMLDTTISDADDAPDSEGALDFEEASEEQREASLPTSPQTLENFRPYAAEAYERYRRQFRTHYKWLPGAYFTPALAEHLLADAQALCKVLAKAQAWDPQRDTKLDALCDLVTKHHPTAKLLVFTEFADTADYLGEQLAARGVAQSEAVTGSRADPTALCRRFSPGSNHVAHPDPNQEVRVLIATDILSEGQNLQDSHIVVNFDLPWAIIRLVQRAGRVDRIGQQHDTITVYSFLPADGVDRIIRLRARISRRLLENQEVVGTDEQFFGEDMQNKLRDLYTERASALDEIDDDNEVDLSSAAMQVWNSASDEARRAAQALPPLVYATRAHQPAASSPAGALVYLRTGDGADALVRVDTEGKVVSQSISGIFRDAACSPDTPALPRDDRHHDWVAAAVTAAATDDSLTGGRLGPPRSIRRRTYERLKLYLENARGTLLATPDLEKALTAIFDHALTTHARDTLSRQLKLLPSDETFVDVVRGLHDAGRLVVVEERPRTPEPDIICSIGLKPETPGGSHAD